MVDLAKTDALLIEIEVAYAKPEMQTVVTLSVPQGTTILDAVKLANLKDRFAEINYDEFKMGVFGVICKPEHLVKEGDRVEVYRPLLNDPKEARRQRAIKK